MKANPGGNIDPEFVMGRERLIENIWTRLDRQCVLLHAERRIGKTSVVKKMVAAPPDGWFGVYQDLEDVQSAAEFAATVYQLVQKFLSQRKRVVNTAIEFWNDHDFGNLTKRRERPWKKLLTASIGDLIAAKADLRLVMFWDEVPFMIANIARAEGEQTASEVLDTLRRLRQEYSDELRMLFTGSIGLHHVLSSLHGAGIATEPVNDMLAIEVAPLAPTDARDLAKCLIQGEGLRTGDLDAAADSIAIETDGFAFYIHHVVCSLQLDQLPAEPEQIRELVRRHLVDAADPWELRHFRTRIPIYYRNTDDATLVGLILDELCCCDNVCSLTELRTAIDSQSDNFGDRDQMVQVLRLMERDNYLMRDIDGCYQFRFELVRRWWKLDRGVS